MSRMILAAVLTMSALMLAATILGDPSPATPSSKALSEPLADLPDVDAAGDVSAEVDSILEARRQLGSVIEGTSLDQHADGADFVEAIEDLLER